MAGVFASDDSPVLSVRTWVFIPVSLSDHPQVTECHCRERAADPGIVAPGLVAGGGEAREVTRSWFPPMGPDYTAR